MANPLLLADYLFLRGAIVARLVAQLSNALPVVGVENMGQVSEANLARDTIFVLWDGERFPDTAGAGASTMVEHRWLVLLAVKNQSQAKDARDQQAGPMLSRVHKALAGWTPEGAGRPFKRATGVKPDYRNGVALYPLTFAIFLTL